MNKLTKLQSLSLIVLTGFLIALAFDHICASYLGVPIYPRCTFLFRPDDAWGDFLWVMAFNKSLDPFHTTFRTLGINYPPFAHLLMLPFTNILEWPWAPSFYLACTATAMLAFVGWACRTRREDDPSRFGWVATLIIGLASYPVLFAMDRLNAENLIFLVAAMGFVAETSGSRRWSPVLWGTACATKVYPGLFGLLYVVERRWKDLAGLAAVAAGWTVVSMAVFHVGPSELLASYARGVPRYQALTVWFTNVQHSSSLFAVVRLFYAWRYGIDPAFREITFEQAFNSYAWLAGLLLIILLSAAGKKSALHVWERLLLITTTIIVIPQTSFDYKLLYLFLPLAAFLNDESIDRTRAYWLCAGFGLLLIPKHYFVFFEDISSSVVLNPLILLVMSFPLVAKAWSPEIRTLFGRRGVASADA